MKSLFFLPLSPCMGCLLIEAVLENNKLLEPPPPPSLLNSHYSDLLARQEPFLLLRKWPQIICISMCKVGPMERGSTICWDGQVGGEGSSAAPSPVTDSFDSRDICLGNQKKSCFPIPPHSPGGSTCPGMVLPSVLFSPTINSSYCQRPPTGET